MKKKYLPKLILLTTLILCVFAGGAGFRAWMMSDRAAHTDGKLQIHTIDVGQGDATLLCLPTGERLLVDTGTAESAEKILAHLARWQITAIDLVILSHNHSDHAGGLPILANALPIGGVLYTGEPPTDCTLPLREVTAGDSFSLGEVTFSVLGPLTDDDINNLSMILRVDYRERSFLFTGDAEAEEEEQIVAAHGALLDVDFLKVAHHGSASSSTEAFLAAVTPQVAVISASEDNSFGHPSLQTLERLELLGCMIFRTDRSGTLVFLCDGYTLTRYTLRFDFYLHRKKF